MVQLSRCQRRLMLETPYIVRGRPLVAHIEASGLRLREKGRRWILHISWAQVHNRAAEIAADLTRQEKRRRRTVSADMRGCG